MGCLHVLEVRREIYKDAHDDTCDVKVYPNCSIDIQDIRAYCFQQMGKISLCQMIGSIYIQTTLLKY